MGYSASSWGIIGGRGGAIFSASAEESPPFEAVTRSGAEFSWWAMMGCFGSMAELKFFVFPEVG